MGITAKKIRLFQSTPPVKAATSTQAALGTVTIISIHAAREGGDGAGAVSRFFHCHFNPRRP